MGKGRIENLKPWPPGVSGNPSGRPKRKPISDQYAKLADTVLPDEMRRKLKMKEGTTFGQAVALRIFMKAMTGNSPAARELREAVEGRAPQAIALTDTDGNDIPQKDRMAGADNLLERITVLLDAKDNEHPPEEG